MSKSERHVYKDGKEVGKDVKYTGKDGSSRTVHQKKVGPGMYKNTSETKRGSWSK